MPDEEIGFLLEMYCQSSVYMTVKWVTEGTKMPPERLAELMVKDLKISELFEQLEILYSTRHNRGFRNRNCDK